VSVLEPTPEPTLTLITCYPIGTNLDRLIVRAKQIEPKIKKTKKKSAPKSLPEIESLPGR
jgi:LPXTG-site transpeptidase (sortase) family protein